MNVGISSVVLNNRENDEQTISFIASSVEYYTVDRRNRKTAVKPCVAGTNHGMKEIVESIAVVDAPTKMYSDDEFLKHRNVPEEVTVIKWKSGEDRYDGVPVFQQTRSSYATSDIQNKVSGV